MFALIVCRHISPTGLFELAKSAKNLMSGTCIADFIPFHSGGGGLTKPVQISIKNSLFRWLQDLESTPLPRDMA